ncbi:MAG: hypothetical protein J6S67_26255 [Methanobrevibacter sp.]|nr:hypothetical protein [Methanobrevibacter sp.]
MNPLLAFGETATTIDWTPITSVVTVSAVIDLVQSAFALIAVAVMCTIVVSVIQWGIGMIRNIF